MRIHPGRRSPAQRSLEPSREGWSQRGRLAVGNWRCSNLFERSCRTRMRERSSRAQPCAPVASRFQTAQAMSPSKRWPPQPVGRHLSTCSQPTTEYGSCGDMYHRIGKSNDSETRFVEKYSRHPCVPASARTSSRSIQRQMLKTCFHVG